VAHICQVINKSTAPNEFHDEDDNDANDVEKQIRECDFASLHDVKVTTIDEQLDNSGVKTRSNENKRKPTKRRRKQVHLQ